MGLLDREDYNSPEYKAWRYAVLARDGWTCQMTGQKGGDLEVHHIIPWAKAQHLRYVVSNGITLSKSAHEMVTGREQEYEEKFKRMVEEKKYANKPKVGRKPKAQSQFKWRPRNPNMRYGY